MPVQCCRSCTIENRRNCLFPSSVDSLLLLRSARRESGSYSVLLKPNQDKFSASAYEVKETFLLLNFLLCLFWSLLRVEIAIESSSKAEFQYITLYLCHFTQYCVKCKRYHKSNFGLRKSETAQDKRKIFYFVSFSKLAGFFVLKILNTFESCQRCKK